MIAHCSPTSRMQGILNNVKISMRYYRGNRFCSTLVPTPDV